MAYFHHTIRRYTSVLLDKLNELVVPYIDKNGNECTQSVPFVYGTREKFNVLSTNTDEQIKRGNLNVLPRGYLKMDVMNRDEGRMLNKNIKINKFKHDFTQEYSYNAIPYNFMFTVEIMCRGMNEATCLTEQIAVIFNPTAVFDVYDADNLDEPTRVPIKLMDCNASIEDYDETSMNIATITASLELDGWLYPPIRSYEKIKELIMSTNGTRIDKEIYGWDIINTEVQEPYTKADKLKASEKFRILNLLNETESTDTVKINPDTLIVGSNTLRIDYNSLEHVLCTFKCVSMSANAIVDNIDANILTLNVLNLDEDILLEITGTDAFENTVTFIKQFKSK